MKASDYVESISTPHCPVLLKEVIDSLELQDGGSYLDCTFGAGGYSKAILAGKNCFLTAIDQDPTVLQYAEATKQEYGEKFNFIQTNFADAHLKLPKLQFDGIVLDLGISSMQVDEASRGFSFMQDGPLDMRMNNIGQTAKEWLADAPEHEIADVIYKYADEVQSRAIARSIVNYRANAELDTTLKLAEIVRAAKHYCPQKIDPATKTFQAIRIHINQELQVLERFLGNAREILKDRGRLVVVSFHSLEDVIVKNFFKEFSARKVAKSKYAKKQDDIEEGKWLRTITKKPITPSSFEVKNNPRSRSAKLRVAEKIGGSHVT